MPSWTRRRPPVAQRVLAVVPARGGSKGVPHKNLREVGGVPLVTRAVRSLLASRLVDDVVVSTDDKRIADVAAQAGATIMARPARLATDTASSEATLLNTLERVAAAPEVLVLVQATSPFIRVSDLDIAIGRVLAGECDVVFAGVRTHAFLWEQGSAGVVGVNHDSAHRARRQDRAAQYQETGAFYVMRTSGFREARHRFFGTIGVALTDPRFAVEIDEETDLETAEALAPLFDAHLADRGVRDDPDPAASAGTIPDRKDSPWLSPSVPAQ